MTSSIQNSGIQKVQTRGYVDQLSRHLVFKMLDQLSEGHLVLEEAGRSYCFGQPRAESRVVAHVSIKEKWVYRKLVFHGSVGAGEAYMQGGWDSDDLLSVIQVFCMNQKALQAMDRRWTRLGAILSKVFHGLNRNTLSGARENISAHYDLSNEFFSLFLDPTMMYSSAIYPNASSTLEQASINKLQHICERLDLQATDHLLEIGTGWGSMAIHAAKEFGCRVTTTTISREQYEYALAAVRKQGLEDRVEVLLKDYRELEGTYDKLVSIEMIEAVGHRYYQEYFNRCSQLLKPDGLLLIQSITIADQRYERASRTVDFIQRYIFPGGALPSVQVIASQVSNHTNMQIVGLEDITGHYADTLADWRKNFFAKIKQVRALGFDEIFERMWEYYLCYCEGGFRERMISTVQVLAAKPDRRKLPGV